MKHFVWLVQYCQYKRDQLSKRKRIALAQVAEQTHCLARIVLPFEACCLKRDPHLDRYLGPFNSVNSHRSYGVSLPPSSS